MSASSPILKRFAARLHEQRQSTPQWYYNAPLIVWILFLTWASLTPPNDLPLSGFHWAHMIGHLVCYSVLGVLFLSAWLRGRPSDVRAVATVWAICFLWGAYLELMQWFTPDRGPSPWDAMRNGIGVAFGEALWLLTRPMWRRTIAPMPEATSLSSNESLSQS